MNTTTEITVVKDKTFETIESAVNKMVDFIRPTYGPASNKVIIDKQLYRMVVDDGVQIARDFELPDPAEDAIVKLIRETAVKTNDRVGDGTTGALIMLQAMVNVISRKSKRDGHKIEQELKKGLEDVKKQITESAIKIETKDDLKKVALISFDDERIAEMIADTYAKLGKDGIITIDKSSTLETTCEISDGLSIKRGYISPYMITNPERMEAVVEKPYILLTDYRITEINDVLPIMEKMVKANTRELIVVCENMEQNALATAVVNKIQGKFALIAINLPHVDDKKVYLEDLALLTGAKVFTESKGDKLEKAEIADLGRAERFICKQDESVIVKPKGDEATIAMSVTALRGAVENEKDEQKKKVLEKRLGMFTNSIAVIKVGALTENEQKTLKYKVEDAVNAVKAAYRSGVVCGSGLALARLTTSSPILNEALQYPARQLRENMGLDEDNSLADGTALNVVTGEVGPFLEVGVMDPADVLIAGVESAVSIATLLVTGYGILVEREKDDKKN